MVKTRRSFNPASPSQLVPSHTQKRRKQIETLLKGNQRGQTQQQVSFSLLTTLFCRSISGLWFRVLPSDDGFNDICTATGLEWRYILPLLMDVGLIVDRTTSVVKNFDIVHKQWNEISTAVSKNVRLQVTVEREKTKGRIYYVCIGEPTFNSPRQERKHRQTPELSLPMSYSPYERKLDEEIKKQAMIIVKRRFVQRVLQMGQDDRAARQQRQAITVQDEEVDRIADDVENQIQAAEQLDLHRMPRLSRLNSGECFGLLLFDFIYFLQLPVSLQTQDL